ncbi:MAG: class I SAM-dependent methyltransferase [Acinetobacter sp.]|nr:class I SAM-dependent methyltransferase [Acinetobacter sp.]
MTPQSEVLLRQLHLCTGRVLLVNPPADDLCCELLEQAAITHCHIWTWNYADHCYFQRFASQGVQSHFAIDYPTALDDTMGAAYEQVIVFNVKAKKLLHYVLYQICRHRPAQSSLLLVGEKKAGIEGAAKVLQQFGKAHKIDSARHCQVWQLYSQVPEKIADEHWLQRYPVQLPLADGTLKIDVVAWVGVFSQNGLDVGTAELLPYLPQVKAGKIADFGCGAGVIAALLAKLQPHNQIVAYDVDAFALASTALTCQANGITQVAIQAVQGVHDIATDFDAIVSNPPFHQGVNTDYQVSEALCHTAKQHLNAKGQVWIVANRFLNYPVLLQQHFTQCDIKADKNGFKVLYATH